MWKLMNVLKNKDCFNMSKKAGMRYHCTKCDFKTSNKFNLKTHRKSIHEGIKYPCDQCDYKATALSSHKNSSKVNL